VEVHLDNGAGGIHHLAGRWRCHLLLLLLLLLLPGVLLLGLPLLLLLLLLPGVLLLGLPLLLLLLLLLLLTQPTPCPTAASGCVWPPPC
jgi:hypothetical protein